MSEEDSWHETLTEGHDHRSNPQHRRGAAHTMARFDDLKAHILCRVYQEAYTHDDAYRAPDATRLAPTNIPKQIAIKAIEALIGDGMLEGQVGHFEISAKGIEHVELQLQIDESTIAKIAKTLEALTTPPGDTLTATALPPQTGVVSGAIYTASLGGNMVPPAILIANSDEPTFPGVRAGPEAHNPNLTFVEADGAMRAHSVGVATQPTAGTSPSWGLLEIPASDRAVTLYHNGNPYREAVAALDRAVTAFREDHHFDNTLGPEKNALLRTLDAGRDLLQLTKVNVSSVIIALTNPLRALVSRYQDAIATGVVEALTKTAVDNLLHLAGEALEKVWALIQ